MADPASAPPRPRSVDVAIWLLIVGAVLLLVGGLLAATLSFDTVRQMVGPSISDDAVRRTLTVHRGAGVFCVLAGVVLAFFTGKTRGARDPRFRRATVALGLAVVVLVSLAAVFAGTHPLALLGLLPTIIGAALLSRPAAAQWYSVTATGGAGDG